MYFIVGLPKSSNKSVIMVVIDHLSKYAHFCALQHPFKASTIAQVFMDNILKLYGMLQSIVTERDPIFTSNFWQEFFRLQGNQLKLSTAYNPQTDGQTEAVHKCFEAYFRCCFFRAAVPMGPVVTPSRMVGGTISPSHASSKSAVGMS